MAVEINKRRFTAYDYQRMGQTGILSEDDRVELIDGEVVAMTPLGPRHCAAVDRATHALVSQVGDQAIVRVQGAVRLDLYHEPQPDLVLLRPKSDFYASGHPGPPDILLIIEIADSSFAYDRDMKGPIYARLGIREYWLADLNENLLSCHADPRQGAYRRVRHYRRGESVAPELLPECVVTADVFLAD